MHLVQSVYDGQNGIDHKGKFGIFIVGYAGETFAFWPTVARWFIATVGFVVAVTEFGQCAAELLLPVLAEPDVARVVVNVQSTEVLLEARHAQRTRLDLCNAITEDDAHRRRC